MVKRTAKWLGICAAIALSVSLVLSGCANKPAPTTPVAVPMPWEKWPIEKIPAEWKWPEFFITQGVSTRYTDAVAMAELLKKHTPIQTQVAQFGGGSIIYAVLISGEANWSDGEPGTASRAFLSTGEFEGSRPGSIRGIAWVSSPVTYGMAVRTASGIKTPYDLKGKRVGYSDTIPMWSIMQDAVLKAYGMARKDVNAVPYGSSDDAVTMIKEDLLDMVVLGNGAGQPRAVEITDSGKAFFLSIDPDKIDAAVAATGGLYGVGVSPAGSFKGQAKDVSGFSAFEGMYVKTGLPESLGYTIARVLWEYNKEWVSMASSTGKHFDSSAAAVKPAVMVTAVDAGAIRYYKEIGLWGSEQEKRQQELEGQVNKRLTEWEGKKKK